MITTVALDSGRGECRGGKLSDFPSGPGKHKAINGIQADGEDMNFETSSVTAYMREERERLLELREILDRMTLGQAFQFKGILETLLDLMKMKIRNGVFHVEPGDQTNRSDELLNVKQAAELLNVSVDWLYRRADRLPFTKRLSRKALRFSKNGLLKYRDAKKN